MKKKLYISFQKRTELGLKLLSKQYPVTLEEARKQAQYLKTKSAKENKSHKY